MSSSVLSRIAAGGFIVTAAWLLADISPAAAQPAPSPPIGDLAHMSLEQLGAIEVTTVSKEPEAVWQAPAAVYVLTQDDIRRSGATSIPEALRRVPGVQVSRIDSDHWAVGVRGLTGQFSKSLLVLIDGRSVYTPLFGGVYWQIQDTLLDDVDRIEIVRGPGGTIWGANAVNGIINIVTRSARDTLGALAIAGGGNVDQGIAGFRYGGEHDGNLFYRVYGKGFMRDHEAHSDGEDFDEWHMGQTGFRLDWQGSTSNRLTVQGNLYKGTTGDRTGVGSYFPPSQTMLVSSDDVSGGNLLFRWQRATGARSDIQVQGYYDRTHRLATHYGETRDTFDVDVLQHVNVNRRHDLLFGAGARSSIGDFTQTVPALTFSPEDRTNHIISVFGQDELTVVPDQVWLTVGMKVEHNTYTGFEAQPTARAVWRPSGRQTIWGAVTRAVRTPSRLDTDFQLTGYLTAGPIFLRIAGNPEFMSERLLGYEAGYRTLMSPKFYVDFAAYHNDYDYLASLGAPVLTLESTPIRHALFTFTYENGVGGTTDGFEIAPDWTPAPFWHVKGMYSYLHIDMHNRRGSLDTSAVAAFEGSSPAHQVGIESSIDFAKAFEIDAAYRYVSALSGPGTDGYPTADARLAWNASKQLSLAITGHDLLQPTHLEFPRDPGPDIRIRRSVYATVTWRR